MKFKWIVLSLATLVIAGCGDTVSKQRTVDELNYQVIDLKKAAEKAELRLSQLESTNIKLEEQNDKLMLLKKKMDINAEYIEELRNSAFEIMPPDDLKIVRLTPRKVAEDSGGIKSTRVKKYSSIPKVSAGATVKDAPKTTKTKTTPTPAKVATAPAVIIKKESLPAKKVETKAVPTPGVVVLKERAKTTLHASSEDLTGTIEELYKRGLDANFANEFKRSREIFALILEKYPTHSLADNALYWTGETYFSSKQYQKAIKVFTEVVKRFPKENKTPDALLKAGFSFLELEKIENAKKILKKVISLYPNTEAATSAQEKLREL